MKKIFLSVFILLLFSFMGIDVASDTLSSEASLPFEDVVSGSWYYDSFEFCYSNGIVQGIDDYRGMPDALLTRESAIAVLARISGEGLEKYNKNYFDDTVQNSWYSNSVAWAYEKGYTKGIGNGLFGIGKNITREEFALLIYNYACDSTAITLSDSIDVSVFADSKKISLWAREGMLWCMENGIIKGRNSSELAPKDYLSRAEMTRMTEVFLLEIKHGGCSHRFSEATCIKSGKCILCGMSIGLPKGHLCSVLSCISGSECKRCGEYILNDSRLHDFAASSCIKKERCRNCGIERGEYAEHIFGEASCIKLSSCKICNKTRGEYAPHKYIPASCIIAERCSVCSIHRGFALGHTTYNGICGRCGGENYRTKIIRTNNIYQMKDYPNGCEAVSTVMALRYYGYTLTVDYFIDNYLPMGPRPVLGGYGPDPAEVFCGDPRSMTGWGCYSSVIAKSLDGYLNKDKHTYYRSTSKTLKTLCDEYIDKNVPVIVWATINMTDSSDREYYRYWKTENGKTIAYNSKLHCLLLVGYDKDNYYFNDPTKDTLSYTVYPKAKAEKAFSILGNQSVAIVKK